MYIPAAFRIESPEKIARFIRQYSFATLVTHGGASSFASHLPILFRPERGVHGTLLGHLARANEQWRHFANGQEALCIFHGPHAYISPAWYESSPAVPTWNYAVVHAYGVPQLIDDPARLNALIEETVATYETSAERRWEGGSDFREMLLKAIVGFEIPVTPLEAKFKLGQNRSEADLHGVVHALSISSDAGDRALAELMQAEVHETKR